MSMANDSGGNKSVICSVLMHLLWHCVCVWGTQVTERGHYSLIVLEGQYSLVSNVRGQYSVGNIVMWDIRDPTHRYTW